MSNILGIGGYSHDASAALYQDGVMVAAAEEERFTRVKHQNGWPRKAIDFCLSHAGLTAADVDHVAFYWKPASWAHLRGLADRLRHLPAHPAFSAGFLLHSTYDTAMYVYHLRRQRRLSGGKARIHYVRHHDCHAASVYFTSPVDDAAVLTIDSRGEWATTVRYRGRGNRLTEIDRVNLPNSIGNVYLCTTNFLGFRTGDEYKVMGLAAYGEPTFADKFRQIVRLTSDGRYTIDESFLKVQHSPGRFEGYVAPKFLDLLGPARTPDSEITQRHKDIAASLQLVLEETCFHMMRDLHARTGARTLCLSGGVAQNSVMCGKITRETPFEDVFIHPASGDNGTSLGAAAWVHNQVLGLPRGPVLTTAYHGPEYSEAAIRKQLEIAKLPHTRPHDLVEEVANRIIAGRIIGWFQGRMEWGARALGNRSILADVTNPEMTNIVNRYVKHREDFRPFAPAMLAERAAEYFDMDGETPYMLHVVPANAKAKATMPAIVHVDDSARLQTVSREQNPLFHALITRLGEKTGVPCVLNTSFNIKGEPMVCSPMDAIKCWASTGIDVLVLGPYLLEKPPVDGSPRVVGDTDRPGTVEPAVGLA